jgi:DNA mismatch repair protein MutL
MAIRILPPEVASQIAAGEVVERPASVVKELLENALDAGASLIKINIEQAGQKLVEISDDGSGIPAEELALAVERHATSKLAQAADLFDIETLGFRGEALASIASVSRLTITSRPAQAPLAAQLHVEGGRVGAVQQIGAPVGTMVRVQDLFFNTPARLKFLKSPASERRRIDNLVVQYALAYPQTRFHLYQDGKAALQTSGNGRRRETLAAQYGAEIARQMLEVDYSERDLQVSGFISPTALTRSNRREILFFVNGRPVQDSALSSALLRGYHTYLMVGRYPLAALFIDIPAEAVDVNVHPAKAEVRFRNPETVFSGVQNAVRRALLAHNAAPRLDQQVRWRPPEPWEAPTAPDPAWEWGAQASQADLGTPLPEELAGLSGLSSPGQSELPGERPPLLRLVGQIANTYLAAEGPDGLYLIDQHAAHERILFERFMAQRSKPVSSQTLLQPATVDLPVHKASLLNDHLPTLASLGFQVEAFGSHTFLVRAIPALLTGSDPAAALHVLVEDFEEDETPLQAEVEARLIARICKRAAVKAGKSLSSAEQQALLKDLEACQAPRTCPHGRPTMIHLPVDTLERQFGRKGAR